MANAKESNSSGLAGFILTNLEPILKEWEDFARSVWRGADPGPEVQRDHAKAMLEAVAQNMGAEQSSSEQAQKSKGRGEEGYSSRQVDAASDEHARVRYRSGFDMQDLVSEYRALRSSVIRQWRKSAPGASSDQIEELIRFDEAIDQLLSKSVVTYAAHVQQSRRSSSAFSGTTSEIRSSRSRCSPTCSSRLATWTINPRSMPRASPPARKP